MKLPKLYNTLTRNVEELSLREPGRAYVYCCGPTVYDVPHAGHARAASVPDMLVRHLRARGVQVTYARNITDVDDKILDRARKNEESPLVLSERMAEVYRRQMIEIGCLPPDHEPKVSDHLPQIYVLIEKLIERGSAYVVELPEGKRDVYFSVRNFADYGKLSRRRIDELLVGARVEAGEIKRDPLDFALWKGQAAEEWGWDSPWGRGRPGWHIECSAMSTHYLGHGFDVHAGGMDLIFPHHENEIAQSEAADPEAGAMARLWLHNGFVNVDKEKMAKSLGNFVTVEDVLARNDAEAFRWFLLTVHYRGPIQFDSERKNGRVVFPGVDEAERRVDYLYTTLKRLSEVIEHAAPAEGALPPELLAHRDISAKSLERAEEGLDDDLNTPIALAALAEVLKSANELCDLAQKRGKDARFAAQAAAAARALAGDVRSLCERLGLLRATAEEYFTRTRARRLNLRGMNAAAVEARVSERGEARRQKDFSRADAIRSELLGLGVSLKDDPAGTSWTIEP
jgi:cysteinyl-tRNA synthetase